MTYESRSVATKEVAAFAKLLGYRRKTARIIASEAVTLTDLNWSGGTRSQYTAVNLDTMKAVTPDLGRPAPWDNRNEGARVEIPPGVAIVKTGFFCGKPSVMVIYVHPSSLPKALPSP